MNLRNRLITAVSVSGFLVAFAFAQKGPVRYTDTVIAQEGQSQGREGQNGPRPLFGKITAMHDGTLELTGPDGQAVTVKLTKDTEFRKDRQPAKVADFKVGDLVMVRGDQNLDHTVTAKMIATRSGMGTGPGGGPPGGGMFFGGGTLGKDFVIGEVKAIDPPRLTILRTDNVTQTLELNEDTTLRRGRDSITMADIQVGDHVASRGALQNNVFVPQGVMVMNAEQWQRMQNFLAERPGNSGAPAPKP